MDKDDVKSCLKEADKAYKNAIGVWKSYKENKSTFPTKSYKSYCKEITENFMLYLNGCVKEPLLETRKLVKKMGKTARTLLEPPQIGLEEKEDSDLEDELAVELGDKKEVVTPEGFDSYNELAEISNQINENAAFETHRAYFENMKPFLGPIDEFLKGMEPVKRIVAVFKKRYEDLGIINQRLSISDEYVDKMQKNIEAINLTIDGAIKVMNNYRIHIEASDPEKLIEEHVELQHEVSGLTVEETDAELEDCKRKTNEHHQTLKQLDDEWKRNKF